MSAATELLSPSKASSIDQVQTDPIVQFDSQLKILSDSYLSFFNERCAESVVTKFDRNIYVSDRSFYSQATY